LKTKGAKSFLALLPSACATLETFVNKYEHGIACLPYCPAQKKKKKKKKNNKNKNNNKKKKK
jgi:hypothetical protein